MPGIQERDLDPRCACLTWYNDSVNDCSADLPGSAGTTISPATGRRHASSLAPGHGLLDAARHVRGVMCREHLAVTCPLLVITVVLYPLHCRRQLMAASNTQR